MKIHFLGTNGWYTTETGNTPCVLIDAKEAYVVLDAGNALYKLDSRIRDERKPIHLFLSHFHLDHINGLHTLLKFGFRQGMNIWGQPGTKKILQTFLNRPFTAPVQDLRMHVRVHELKEGRFKRPFPLETRPLVHADPCWGYRFQLEGKTIAYCTDTGRCNNLQKLARDADLLISECAWKKRNESAWPHLSPYDAAEMAKSAGAKRLALMHFDARNYQTMEDRRWAEQEARMIFPNTFAARDDMAVELK